MTAPIDSGLLLALERGEMAAWGVRTISSIRCDYFVLRRANLRPDQVASIAQIL